MQEEEDEKYLMLTFAAEWGLGHLLKNEDFCKKNKKFFSRVSKLIVYYTEDGKYFEREEYEKAGVELDPRALKTDVKDNAEAMFELIRRERKELLDKPAYFDMNHGTSEMRMVAVLLWLQNPRGALIKKVGEREKNRWKEETVELQPYEELNARKIENEIEFAKTLMRNYQFNAAKLVLEKILNKNSKENTKIMMYAEHLIDIAKMLFLWDRFAHHKRERENPSFYSSKIRKVAEEYIRKSDYASLCREISDFLGKCLEEEQKGYENDERLVDRYNNAKIRIELGMYDDAVARLYALVEAIAKRRLMEKHGIDNSDVQLSEQQKELLSCSKNGRQMLQDFEKKKGEQMPRGEKKTGIKIEMVRSYLLLACLDDEVGRKFFHLFGKGFDKDVEINPNELELLDKRNSSILAHGYKAVKEEDAKKWRDVALQFLESIGIDYRKYPSISKLVKESILLDNHFA